MVTPASDTTVLLQFSRTDCAGLTRMGSKSVEDISALKVVVDQNLAEDFIDESEYSCHDNMGMSTRS